MQLMSLSTSLQVKSIEFPPSIKPPGATNTLFLVGAGVRDLVMEGTLMSITGYGMYLEDEAICLLAEKWKGKTTTELTNSHDFYNDIITSPYEKVMQMTMIITITGEQYSNKAHGLCTGVLKANGTYTDADVATFDRFLEVFKEHNFPPGASVLYTFSPDGSIAISFSKDGMIPESPRAVLENKKAAEAIIEAVIGENGNSPATRQSMASILSDTMKK